MALRLETQRKVLVVILAVAAIACASVLEATKTFRRTRGYTEKRAAVDAAQKAYDALRDYYQGDLGRRINLGNDPASTGLIGPQGTAFQNAAGNVAATDLIFSGV